MLKQEKVSCQQLKVPSAELTLALHSDPCNTLCSACLVPVLEALVSRKVTSTGLRRSSWDHSFKLLRMHHKYTRKYLQTRRSGQQAVSQGCENHKQLEHAERKLPANFKFYNRGILQVLDREALPASSRQHQGNFCMPSPPTCHSSDEKRIGFLLTGGLVHHSLTAQVLCGTAEKGQVSSLAW